VAGVLCILERNTFIWSAGGDGSRASSAPRFTVSDWCCGIGSWSFGAQRAGIESQRRWSACFEKSFGVDPAGDLRTQVDGAPPLAAPGSIAVQLASPECTVFSQAGSQRALDCPKAMDDWTQMFLRLAVELPDSIALENVCGLVTMHEGSVLDWVLQNLQAVGYATAWTIGSPWMLGLPFNRPQDCSSPVFV
jgi:site-specific DNA-cytosine methylase